ITSMIHHQKQSQQSIRVPKSICDLSEDVLISGIQFPGRYGSNNKTSSQPPSSVFEASEYRKLRIKTPYRCRNFNTIIISDDQIWSWSCGLARLLLQYQYQDQDQDGTGLARPRPRLGLQEQDQTNTEAARSRPKQDHHCKTLAVLQNFFFPENIRAVDRQGNAVILWVEGQSEHNSETMSDVNAAELILYYASLRNRNERNSSLTILVHENSCTSIEFVDCVLELIKHQVSVDKVIFCTKRHAEGNRLKYSQIRCYAVNSYNGLLEFFEDSQIPSACGGSYAHTQLEWIDFYKESERLTYLSQTAGNRLVTAIADMGNVQQERNAISKFLDDSDIKNLLQDARQSMEILEQHARWLNENRFVMSSFEDVKKFHSEVEGAAVRLEELLLQKKKKIMQAARVNALEVETHEVLSWLTNKGEHALVQHADLANSLPAIRQQEQDFEKFYFVSMVSNGIAQ
ncbi:hypothetical protein AGLY_008176, partial [Aphis glycines]